MATNEHPPTNGFSAQIENALGPDSRDPDDSTGFPNKSKLFSAILCSVFFLSGASALIFETLWFRLAGLTFGNSVWAGALVLASFMAGLALGNWLITSRGNRIKYPVRFYAFLEIVAGSSGLALVILFPFLTGWLKPWFGAVIDMPLLLNFLRLSISFLLITVPTMCMGMTLPLLVKALHSRSPNFGAALGKLYGWNTIGAVFGTLVTEAMLIQWLGIRATGVAAALLNFLAAVSALITARLLMGEIRKDTAQATPRLPKLSVAGKLMLTAGFFSGAILLALEVVWFRFLTLFVTAHSLAFAVMLSVVLAGIGLGGVLASVWFRLDDKPQQNAASIALLSGTLSVVAYVVFGWLVTPLTHYYSEWTHMFYISLILMFPVSLLSGILFTFIGEGLHRDMGHSLEATGLLTMVNTVGAAVGSLLAGFLLLPKVGMEKSFFLLSLSYVLVAILVSHKTRQMQSDIGRYVTYGFAAVFLVSVVLFPFGSMEKRILSVGAAYLSSDRRWVPVAIREGLTETSQYWQRGMYGKPLYTWLLTNNHAMSTTRINGRRYMKFFVYLPVVIHPDLKNALLICYGVGCTAQALTGTPDIKSIDVVDISKDIADSSAIVYPDPKDDPLKDPRVRTHIEDGRFFLQTTSNRYDLITGEPPPPGLAGVVNLYSQEYFQLVHDCLREGGIVTYWLPVHDLTDAGAKSVIKAFCNVFKDCSLWTGYGFEWMLVGTRNSKDTVSESQFVKQWNNPATTRELTRLGFEKPEQIGSTFIMDAAALKEFTKDSLPLTDNYPKRIVGSGGIRGNSPGEDYLSLMNTERTKDLFQRSPFISAFWPQPLRDRTLDYFPVQDILNNASIKPGREPTRIIAETIHPILARTSLRFPIYLAMEGHEPIYLQDFDWAARDETQRQAPGFNYLLGVEAIADRRFLEAEKCFAAEEQISHTANLIDYRIYLLCMGGKTEEAQKLIQTNIERYQRRSGPLYLAWLSKTFGLALPHPGRK